jgi:diadenosine tetraphosphate (Ap4A) HIT family hydrolase
MQDLAARGICAFCPEHIHTETRTKIDIETDHWFVKGNDYPYDRTKHHLLLIPKYHVKTVSELPSAAQDEFLKVVARAEEHFGMTSYAVAMRSGDPRYNGGSVEHIHAHIIVGDTEEPAHEPVRFKVSSRPKD